MSNPSNIALLGHRYQVRVANAAATPNILVASRVQSIEPTIRQDTAIYHEIGSVDPTGSSSDAPEMRVVLTENVHAVDLDLELAGKILASSTTWNLGDYNVGNGPYTLFLLERDNTGVVQGELQFSSGVLSEIQWQWRMGQPIDARYTFELKTGQHWGPGHAPHATWGAQDITSPGGIRIKDSRLFLNGGTEGYRVYRLQGFTLRATWRTTVVREAGNRAVVGILAEPPDTNLDIDIAAADHQPDDVIYATTGGTYYDYQSFNTLTGSVIKVYDPAAAEAASVIRAWKIEKLNISNASPAVVSVRGLATKRYSFVLPSVTTAGSGGLLMYNGDVSP